MLIKFSMFYFLFVFPPLKFFDVWFFIFVSSSFFLVSLVISFLLMFCWSSHHDSQVFSLVLVSWEKLHNEFLVNEWQFHPFTGKRMLCCCWISAPMHLPLTIIMVVSSSPLWLCPEVQRPDIIVNCTYGLVLDTSKDIPCSSPMCSSWWCTVFQALEV